MVLRAAMIVSILAMFLTACMNQIGGSNANRDVEVLPDATELSSSEAVFQANVHALLAIHCENCHGVYQAPFIAYPDDVQANHDNLLSGGYVDFQNIEQSRVIQQLRVGHNCWTIDCDEDADTLAEALRLWGQARGEISTDLGIVTDAMTVPALAEDGFVTLSFDLDTAVSALPSDARITFEIRQFDDYSYQIRNLRLISSVDLSLKNIAILINDIDGRPGGTYSLIDVDVDSGLAQGLGYQLSASSILSGMGLGLPTNSNGTPQGGPGVDQISVQFEELQEITIP